MWQMEDSQTKDQLIKVCFWLTQFLVHRERMLRFSWTWVVESEGYVVIGCLVKFLFSARTGHECLDLQRIKDALKEKF